MAEPNLPKRFQVLEEIARNDAEILLRARDELLQREVVISRPSPGLGLLQESGDVERSLRQARALARLQHAGVVRLIDVLETDDGPLLVIEPVPGETLAEVLAREGRIDPARVRDLAIGLCHALEAVHAAGVVHRGVSASNVVLRADGTPCLTGFVFAKFGAAGTGVPGTTFLYNARGAAPSKERHAEPPHPAPEQILGQAADARADVFGLGWVLYQCLTGESPYPIELDCEAWKAPEDPRKRAPATSRALADAVLRCLSPKPLKRFASAKDVREALEAAGTKAGTSAGAASAPPAKRSRIIAGAAAGLVLLAVGSWYAFQGSRSGAEESRGLAVKSFDAPAAGGTAGRYSEKYDRSHALLIGIGEVYAKNGFPALPNAERDVEALAARLKSMPKTTESWEVEVLEGASATRDNIVSRLAAIADGAKENDKVFVYYAGHGVRHEVSEKSGWILPADAVTQEKDPSRRTWVRFDEFGHLFDESRSKHVLVAMDCCYGGRLIASRAVPSAAATYSRRLVTEPAKVIISSGRPNEQVSDGVRGERSPFAQAFLDALSRTDVEAVTTTEIYAAVQRRFLEEEVSHLPVRGNPPGASQAGEVVFFLR